MHSRNGLHILAAAGAMLVGVFLLIGAAGHLQAVLPSIRDGSGDNALSLLLPGLLLAVAGALNVSSCRPLWDGGRLAMNAALAVNVLALIYLVYLLQKGVPGHPVGLFTGIVACYAVLLALTRLGLVWRVGDPAEEESDPADSRRV